MQKKPFRLITIPISHYCEKARWALTKLKVPYVEEPHMPPFHLLATSRVGGKLTPVLITEAGTFTDSTDILKYLDDIAPANAKLYPIDPKLRQKVEELEELFDEQLAPATRQWGYFHIMNNSKLIQQSWCKGVPFFERAFFPIVFPTVRSMLRNRFNITPESAAQAYEQIKSIFAQVDEILADGRAYLVGDSLSAADITFAALAAPAVAPPEHPSGRTNLQELPPKMVAEINAFRETPAGAYVLRLYRDRHRD
ncbi:glutathione S-transferase family protein [Iningainema tapete]|uniref:Glutathione S-transferase n=1 Tax=Iningainema tapete BLCC-T55 TaxID=2748662 RepID=A0A8J6XGB1_9CYAN|nr:glutathione S-transferase family protein [Iningainema tapete]MBD2775329.1 glutathione S-transferase [Iningainema tapete BLCC-T55]